MITSTSKTRRAARARWWIVALIMGAIMQPSPSSAEGQKFGVLEFLNWDYPWGNYKYAQPAEIERSAVRMREAGVQWVRMDFLWDDIEPSQGKFRYEKYDRIVEILTRNGIRVLGLLNYSASWASADGQWNSPPRENGLFVDYAANVISHFKGRVSHWEVWNEPDSATYWKPQDGLVRYCGLLKEVYAAAKKVDPDCVILNGGLANGLGSVHKLYDNGAQGSFDALNIHYFDDPLREGAIHAVAAYPKLAYKVMARQGDGGKTIWITEIGCPGMAHPDAAANWWAGKNPDEAAQARWVREVIGALRRDPHVEGIFWAFFRDCKEHWHSGVDHFGLIRWDFSAKPAYEAYHEAVKE